MLSTALMVMGGAGQAAGDPVRGKQLYETRCIGCHSLDAHRVGPAHRGVFGSRAGTAPGYDYSDALREANILWNDATLDRWLANPEGFIPGQKMGYAVDQRRDRADLIAYLLTQSKTGDRGNP